MRKEMRKFLFLGTFEEQHLFFERAQKIGDFEFISVSGVKPHLFPKHVEELRFALHILKKQQVVEQESVDFPDGPTLVHKILSLKKEIENSHEELRLLTLEIARVEPLGEFDLGELHKISEETGQVVQFFFTRHDKVFNEDPISLPIYLSRAFDFDYYMHIGDKEFSHPFFTEITVTKSLKSLKKEKEKVEKLSYQKEKALSALATYIDFLNDYLLQELNTIHLQFAQEDVDYYLDGKLFGIEAWIPENRIDSIKGLISGLAIVVQEISIKKDDVVPTCLENDGIGRIGQDLVEVYDTPAVTDKDPSSWIVFTFALFFAMIVSDAGYGLLFLLTSIYLWCAFPHLKGVKKRMLKLATILSCATILWGVMIASYFSVKLAPDNPVNRYSGIYLLAEKKMAYAMEEGGETYKEWLEEYPKIASAKEPMDAFLSGTKTENGRQKYALLGDVYNNLLLEIALLFGIIHLTLSFLRNLYRSWMGIGWIAVLWGGYLYFSKMLGATTIFQYLHIITLDNAGKLGEQLLYGGLISAILLAVIQFKWVGLSAIFKVIEVFSDTLSYLRLYALGLAGMVLAETANEMGAMIGGYVIGGIIVIIGHGINIGLCLLAGIIHGLRLHFLEWYHHSFEGGGKKWKPLCLLMKE
ncbi:MAG: hypothetical protein JSR76_02050 [Verrucomicrobia bacterium]|nr:hypothetical protein [Verrucomicrobiota bacterium]